MRKRWDAIKNARSEEILIDADGNVIFDPDGCIVTDGGKIVLDGDEIVTSQPLATKATLPDDPTAARQAVEGERRTTPALTKDHEMMLAFLAKTPNRRQLVIEVAANGRIRNRETVGWLLRELEDIGLVERKYGKKKGYALTTAGLERAKAAT